MKKDLILGLLGLWVVALGFFGLPPMFQRVSIIATGLAICLISTRGLVRHKISKTITEEKEAPRV